MVEPLADAVLQSLPCCVAVLSLRGTILRLHGAWRGRVSPAGGGTRELRIGDNYLGLWRQTAGEPARRVAEGLESVLRRSCGRFAAEYETEGGQRSETQWLELHATPIGSPPGGAVVSLINITARKRAELAASERLRDLARVSRAVTLGVLSGSLAHELNQPLTAILSNAQAGLRLLAAPSPAEQMLQIVRDILLDVAAEGARASEIIRRTRRLLDLGEAERTDIDVNALAAAALRTVADEALLRNVHTEVSLAAELPPVRGDPVQLEQVLVNLFLNAFDALVELPREERRVILRTAQHGRDLVEVVVEDSGHGIPDEQLPRIFEPFYTTKSRGMGLGLYLCRVIIEAHGGCMEIANVRPGLRICICLPQTDRTSRHWPLVQCQHVRRPA